MNNLRRRLRKAEEKLNLNKPQLTVTLTRYRGTLPPDRKEGNITYHYVMYDKKASKN
ncbi:MAG: hypothetical protein ACYS30_17705 [Planctomycetota bacterium]|jgi:hypothetical protein